MFDSPPTSPNTEVEYINIITEPAIDDINAVNTRGNVQIIKIDMPVEINKPKKFHSSIYLCQKCDTAFATNLDFEIHLETHENFSTEEKMPEVIGQTECHINIETNDKLNNIYSKEIKNICPICLVTFKKKSELMRHNSEHPLIIQCDKCNKKFSDDKFLEIHVRDNHSKAVLDCKYCLNKFSTKLLLNNHLRSQHVVCEICFIKCESVVALKAHSRGHVEKKSNKLEKLYPCDKCSKSFRSKSGLERHLEFNHGLKALPHLFYCTLCSLSFNNETLLKYHILNHDTAPDLTCEICFKKFNRISNLNAHIKTHVKDIFCKVCCSSFISQFRLENHLSIHTDAEIVDCERLPNSIECPFENCGQIFPSRLQMYNHKKVHLNIVEHCCSDCDRKFKTISELATHRKIHHESDTYCYTCGKQFSTIKTLREHIRVHTGEKPFECDVCKTQFRCQSSMVAHRAIHSTERRYMCGICKRTFARAAYLKEHLRTHREERPFSCKQCGKAFTQSSALKNHISFKHRVCKICKKTIGNTVDLRTHLFQVHELFNS